MSLQPISRPRPGQRLKKSVEKASYEHEGGRGGSVGGEEPVSARRRRRSKPEGEASWEGSERGGEEGGIEDRKEGTMEGIGEQRARYPLHGQTGM